MSDSSLDSSEGGKPNASKSLNLISVSSSPNDSWYNELLLKMVASPNQFSDYKVEGNQILREVYRVILKSV